jgi:hypothetical protein
MGIVLSLSLMAAASLIGVVTPVSSASSLPQQQKDILISRINASAAVQIYADNSQGSALYIKEASAKEISGDDFAALVGEPSRYLRQTTFPQVTLLNTSPRIIKAFSIAVESAANKKGYVLISPRLSIPPNSTYEVAASQWVRAEKFYVQKGERFMNVWQKPGLDSAKSWIPGSPSDLRLLVCMVEFEDGTRWIIPPDARR